MNKIQKQPEFTPEIVESFLNDDSARIAIARESHLWFFHTYFAEYVKYPTADFQKEIFQLTEDDAQKFIVITAFRGSAKSTIATMSFPLWVIMGRLQKRFVIIISQTQSQAKSHLQNIKREIENNVILRKDFGAVEESSDEWGSYSLFLKKYNARIIAVSTEQSIRGARHGANRPDLIICDDVEDLASVKTREGREKTYNWFKGDILPAGDENTKVMVVGNLLHDDSLLMRLKKEIGEEILTGTYREYPFLRDDGTALWREKYPTKESILALRKRIGNENAWQREYLLRIIVDEDQVIKPEWLKYYDDLPKDNEDYQYSLLAVDLAISQKDTADNTAIVSAHVYGNESSLRVYILPNIVNKRMDFPSTIPLIKQLAKTNGMEGERAEIYIEQVGYQEAVIQQLEQDGYYTKGVLVHGQDKKSRLTVVSHLVAHGKVLFPKKGAEQLITQLLYFGREKHDDLSDAFSILLSQVLKKDHSDVILSWADQDEMDDDYDDENVE